MPLPTTYPGLSVKAQDIRKFLAASDLFTLLLANGSVVHFEPQDPDAFRNWLKRHHIVDIKSGAAE